jgi:choice-of-anchor C domain-containing protein
MRVKQLFLRTGERTVQVFTLGAGERNMRNMLSVSIAASVLIVFALADSLDAQSNLLLNGSFEEGPEGPAPHDLLRAGSEEIVGWIVTKDTIDYIRSYWEHSDGERSLDLDGTPGCGGIAQTVSTETGQDYMVTFDMSGNIGPPTIKTLGVTAAGQSVEFSFDVTGHDYSNMGWETKTWTFIANGPETTIEFFSLDIVCEYAGPALDNVLVAASDGGLAKMFKRGDSSADGSLNLSDAVLTLNRLFLGGPAPSCLDAADADDNGKIQITDAILTLNHLFLGGPALPEPFNSCGSDSTPDELGCAAFPACQ